MLHQARQLRRKLLNQSGPIERQLGRSIAAGLRESTGLPASQYSGDNAVVVPETDAYLWARNLMLLRMVECPIALLEPYVANSQAVYPRIQNALSRRAAGLPLADDDILREYADGVVQGLVSLYGPNH